MDTLRCDEVLVSPSIQAQQHQQRSLPNNNRNQQNSNQTRHHHQQQQQQQHQQQLLQQQQQHTQIFCGCDLQLSNGAQDYHHSIMAPHFCQAYRDTTILEDHRVFNNMLALEDWYVPDTEYSYSATRQNEIRLHMRKIVTEWMLDVCVDQRCQVDVFLLAANIMDRFLGTIVLKKKQFQLLGAAAIFLASKMVEPTPVSAATLVKCTADTYDRDELLSMELLILSKLKWDLTAVTAYDYLDHLIHALQNNRNKIPADYFTSAEQQPSIEEGPLAASPAESFLNAFDVENLRRNTEKTILLCATDVAFVNVPPSLVATAALMSTIQHEFRSLPVHRLRNVNLNLIMAKLQSLTQVETESLKLCSRQIEEIFFATSVPASRDFNVATVAPSVNPSSLNANHQHHHHHHHHHQQQHQQHQQLASTPIPQNQQGLYHQIHHSRQCCYHSEPPFSPPTSSPSSSDRHRLASDSSPTVQDTSFVSIPSLSLSESPLRTNLPQTYCHHTQCQHYQIQPGDGKTDSERSAPAAEASESTTTIPASGSNKSPSASTSATTGAQAQAAASTTPTEVFKVSALYVT